MFISVLFLSSGSQDGELLLSLLMELNSYIQCENSRVSYFGKKILTPPKI